MPPATRRRRRHGESSSPWSWSRSSSMSMTSTSGSNRATTAQTVSLTRESLTVELTRRAISCAMISTFEASTKSSFPISVSIFFAQFGQLRPFSLNLSSMRFPFIVVATVAITSLLSDLGIEKSIATANVVKTIC